MSFDDLVARLMSEDEMAAVRVGLAGAVPGSATAAAAEVIELEPRVPHGLACELILADVRTAGADALSAARRLTRDGLFVAALAPAPIEVAVRAVAACGVDWIAVLDGDNTPYLVAGREISPQELGEFIVDRLVGGVNPACRDLPQNRPDRIRRRHVRRHGREPLLMLSKRLSREHGGALDRIVAGIEILAGERPSVPDDRGCRPGMFAIPGLDATPWPQYSDDPKLSRVMAVCARYGPPAAEELEALMPARAFAAYLSDDYNKTKFSMESADDWQAIRLVDWRRSGLDLPENCPATRAMLIELGDLVSGEVNILRLPPHTALPPHHDDYDSEQYIQIGLAIPEGCAIRVGGQERQWRRGEPIVFSPAFLHEVWNTSDRPRDVIAIDTWHTNLSTVEIAAVVEVRHALETLRGQRRHAAAKG